MSESFRVEGLAELQKALEELPKTAQGKALGDAVKAGATVIRDEARLRAPKHAGPYEGKAASQKKPGTLKRGITIRMKRRINQGEVTASITTTKKAWYGRLVEFGHRIVGRLPKSVAQGGAKGARSAARRAAHASGRMVPPHPFLRPAIDVKGKEAVEKLRDTLGPAIEKRFAELTRRAR